VISRFAEELRERRIAAGLTQEELAHQARCSVGTIAALERGRSKRPRLTTARLLADALGLGSDERAAFLAATEPDVASSTAHPVGGHQWPVLPADLNPHGRTPLAGRLDDLDRLRAWWGAGQGIGVLTGDAGVGKTRLAGELATAVRSAGARVLVGRCPQDLGGPYAPFVEVLRAAARALGDDTLGSALGSNGDLARLLPEVGQRFPSLPRPVAGDAASERYGLFAAATAVLRACGRCLVILDDVQWLDTSSAELLSHVASAPELAQLAVLATARPAETGTPWARALAELTRRRALQAFPVAGLNDSAIAQLVASILQPAQPDTDLVEAVACATAGNPFLAEELVTHLRLSGQMVIEGGTASLRDRSLTLGVPQLVRETLRGRLADLSRPASALLGAGSVLGREFDPLAAAHVAALNRSDAMDAADELLGSGLWAESGSGLVTFSHALVQAAVFDQLSQVRRGEFHRRAAELAETTANPAAPATVSAVARHWREALRVQPELVDRAAAWAVRSGEEALRSTAFAEAVEAFADAAELWEAAGPEATEQLANALLRLGDALGFVGRRTQADDAFRRALGVAEAIGDPALAARAALGIGRLYLYGDVDPVRVETIARVLDRLDAADVVNRPALASMLVSLLEFDDRPGTEPRRAGLRVIVDETLAVAPGEALADLLAFSRPQLAVEAPQTLATAAAAIIARGRAIGDLMMEANGQFCRAWAALGAGDAETLAAVVTDYGTVADRLQLPEEQAYVKIIAGARAQVDGRYGDFDRLTQEAFALNEAAGNRNRFLILATQMSLGALDRGGAAQLLPELRALAAEQPRVSSLGCSIALCAALAGLRDEAVDALECGAAGGFDAIPRDANWAVSIAALAHACALLERRDLAAPLARLLATSRSAVVRVGPILGWWGPVAHHLGALLRLLGRFDDADQQLTAAARGYERFGRGAFVSRTAVERGLLLADLREFGSARQALSVAEAHADELGAQAIAVEAARLRSRLD
jgi:transcriptional regulator with XRE-family HTH domain/tetratricopeptide (TPR) repeat protein